jgi:HlyD family type I secretion membrane fusion protein
MSAISSTKRATTFAGLLARTDLDQDARTGLAREHRRFIVPLLVAAVLLLTWSIAAPLSGAVVANGQLKAELNRKIVQHQEGGIVRQILVRDGEMVHAGQPLVLIGDVRNDAEFALLQSQLDAEQIRSQRASAEAALRPNFDFVLPPDAGTNAREHLAQEKALFDARRRTLDEQVSALQGQIRDAQAQSVAVQVQIDATEVSSKLSTDELAINQKLAAEGYIQKARLLQLQRVEADYRSRLGEQQSELAATRQRSGDLAAHIAQARNQYQQQATDEAKEAATKIREIEERLRPSRDQVERQYVRAPVDGQVMALRVSNIEEVVAPRAAILDILPTREKLIVEARVRPQDINHVRSEQTAEVRLSSFDARTTPLMPGKVLFVSPDRMTSQDGRESWFVVTVAVDAATLKDHPEIRLQAGMPVELFVTTPERSLFQYLTKPLTAFMARGMREP